MYYLYIVKSQSKNWFYVGMTDNLSKRLIEHNLGKTKSTKAYRPVKIVHVESFVERSACRKRELFIKNNHAVKQGLIDKITALSSNG